MYVKTQLDIQTKNKIWISDSIWDITHKRRQVKIQMSGIYTTHKW
jgi:hypothetical protein